MDFAEMEKGNGKFKWETMDETNPLKRIKEALTTQSRDCSEDKLIAFLYGIVVGWNDASYNELKEKHNWSNEDVQMLKNWHTKYNILMENV